MTEYSERQNILYRNLKLLSKYAFPKICSDCGKVYENAEKYIDETKSIESSKNIKMSVDNHITTIELYRKCDCGSVLKDIFTDKKNFIIEDVERLPRFNKMLDKLINTGLKKDVATQELLKLIKGEKNNLFKNKEYDNILDRRDLSEAGIERRKKFGHMIDWLVSMGFEQEIARQELLKIMRGENSFLLKEVNRIVK
ncbi:MAG: hypothetical protein HQK76_02145 [Desulfobacterales bacterium]|nr:hypothetical protein [Desulfobacterales bacterium]